MKKIIDWFKSSKSDFILFIILLVLANLVGHNAFFRLDLTKNKSYSLSKASKQLVRTVQEPVSVRVFFDDNLPSPYNTYAQYIKDLLEEYKGSANKNLTVTFMDVTKEENRNLAYDFGLNTVQIQEVKNNEVGFKQVYMGLVISYGDSIELIDGITTVDGLEYKITSTISRMIDKSDALSGLSPEDKLDLTLYMSEDLLGLGISGADQVESWIQGALYEVNKQNNNRISYKRVSPVSSEALELANKYGIQGINYQKDGKQEMASFGLVLEYKDNFRIIPLSIERSFFGYAIAGSDDFRADINDAISGVLSKSLKVGYVVGHNEMDLESENYCANFNALLSKTYDLVSLDLSTDTIPAGMNSIIINGPQYDFTEEELYKLDQFVMKGGNLMVFLDSMSMLPDSSGYGNTYTVNENNLDRLLEKYGVKRNLNMVMDEECYTQTNSSYGKLNLYWAPVLQKEQLAKHVITNNLGYVIMLDNGSLDLIDTADVKSTVLVKSTDKAWLEEDGLMLNPLLLTPPANKQTYNLAVLLEGKFSSAFDEAVETNTGDDTSYEGTELDASNHIAKGKLAGKVFVTSSSAITTRQVIDENGSNPVAMFVLNLVDYMNGREDLCTMRTKSLNVEALNIKSQKSAKFAQYFNEAGLVILVALVGFIVWRKRSRRRVAIQKKYNPNDQRFMDSKKEKKAESKEAEKDTTKPVETVKEEGADNE